MFKVTSRPSVLSDRFLFAGISALAVLAGAPSVTQGATADHNRAFEIIAQSVHSDMTRRFVTFDLTFSRPPDFFSVDRFNRPATSFQYEVRPTATWANPDEAAVETVIRGDEIRLSHQLRIRTALGEPDADPAAGGWGQVRGSVPFTLKGSELSFDVSFDVLKETDGVFGYSVFATEFGQTRSLVDAVAVPLPAAVWGGSGGLVMAGFAMRLMRRRRLI